MTQSGRSKFAHNVDMLFFDYVRKNNSRGIVGKGKRLVLAVLVSTFSVVPIYFVLSILTGDLDTDRLIPYLMMMPVFAFIGVLLVVLPVHIFLVWKNWSRPMHYWLAGFVIPALFVATTHPFSEDAERWIFWQAILMGTFGVIIALIFRRFALENN